jgi:ribosomal protein L13E
MEYMNRPESNGALPWKRDARQEASEPYRPSVHPKGRSKRIGREVGPSKFRIEQEMTTWHKRDWEQFYELARRPWRRHRPPRPVYPTGINRVLPAQGFSLSELDDAGVDLDLAERLGLPVDAGRIGAYGPNVTVLRDFIRSSRQPL